MDELTRKYNTYSLRAEAIRDVGCRLLSLINDAHEHMAQYDSEVDKCRDAGQISTYYEEQSEKAFHMHEILEKIEESFRAEYIA